MVAYRPFFRPATNEFEAQGYVDDMENEENSNQKTVSYSEHRCKLVQKRKVKYRSEKMFIVYSLHQTKKLKSMKMNSWKWRSKNNPKLLGEKM